MSNHRGRRKKESMEEMGHGKGIEVIVMMTMVVDMMSVGGKMTEDTIINIILMMMMMIPEMTIATTAVVLPRSINEGREIDAVEVGVIVEKDDLMVEGGRTRAKIVGETAVEVQRNKENYLNIMTHNTLHDIIIIGNICIGSFHIFVCV